MKKMRRFAAIAAAAAMTACMAVPMMSMMSASAAGTGAITITDESGATHNTLSAFQIFSAEIKSEQFVVSAWADGIDLTALAEFIDADTELDAIFDGVSIEDTPTSAQAAADAMQGLTAEQEKMIARAFAKSVTGTGTAATTTDGVTKITGLDTGYYIIVDTSAAVKGDYSSYTLGMLTVVSGETATATVKLDFPSFDKKIGDINDTNDAAGKYSYDEAADHDMGDNVPFKLIATVPNNIDKYDTYKMVFHDNLQAGVFDFNDDVTVTYYSALGADGVDVTNSFTVTETNTENTVFSGTKESEKTEDFTVTCADITALNVTAGGYFEVDYTAVLTKTANMGATGNWNSAYLEYSNNPNYSGSGDTNNTANSPEDSVVAFTYQTVINKVDGISGAALKGATFTLKKKMKDGSKVEIASVTANAGTTFVFNGLDDGDYVLTEAAPEGYNPVDPIEFKIVAVETQDNGSEALDSLTATSGAAEFTTGKVYAVGTDTDKTATNKTGAEKGSVSTTIQNFKGASLPSTGGIGTTLFYVIGGTMAAGAGVALIAKKRMKNEE